jgi:membrane protein DedA with SNARE-associated domain
MPSFLNILAELIKTNYLVAYFFLYLAIIFIGNIASFSAFWIIIAGKLNFINIFIVLILTYLGDISGDILWFNLGKIFRGTKIGNFILKKIPNKNGQFEKLIQENGLRWFIYSKFFYGSSPLVVFSMGWSNVNFKKMLRLTLITTLIWLPIFGIISASLILGLIPLSTINIFKKFEWLFIIGLGLFILLEFLLSKLIKKIILKKLND